MIKLSVPATTTATATEPTTTESKADKRERKKKARESGNVAVDLWTPSGAGWAAPSPSPLQEAGSDSSDDDEDVSRMLIGDAVGSKETTSAGALRTGGAPTQQLPPAQAQGSTPANDDSILIAKRRSSLTSAYDRENPITFPSATPATAATAPAAVPKPLPKPMPIRQNKPTSRRRSSAAAAGARSRAAAAAAPTTPVTPQPPPPAAADDYSRYTTVSIFASAPTPATAPEPVPTSGSTRPRRTKRPSTAFDDYAVDFATSAAAGLVDRSASPGPASFAAAAAHSAATSRRRGGGGGGNGNGAASRANGGIGRLSIDMFAPSRKVQRRWRSDLSSASDCDGSAYSSGDDADSDVDFADADAAAAAKPVVEQPLPVLAGLERNLGIEPADGDGAESGGEPLAFGEAFTGVVAAHELLDAGNHQRPRRSVRWIEGPERRKRRAMAAAAAAGPANETATVLPPSTESETVIVKKEEQSDAPPPPSLPQTTRSVSPCDPFQLFSPPPLKRSSSLPADPAAKVSTPKSKEDRPPPYEALRPSEETPAPPHEGAAAATTPTSSENRSAKDVKLAFALLDAVRAAVSGVIGSPSRGGEGSSGGIGAALQAALTTGHSATSSPTTKAGGSDAMQIDSEPIASSSAEVGKHEGGTIDYQAHELEAKRRLEALAAQEQVDPGKAFKPTARDGAEAQLFIGSPACHDDDADDEAVEAHLTGAVKSEPITDRAEFGFEVSFRVSAAAAAETTDFDTDSPIDDLWTPASVADSISTAPSTSASNSFGEDPLCGGGGGGRRASGPPIDANSPPSPALVDEYPLFAAAVAGGGLTPPPQHHGGAAIAIPRTPTRGLLASGALRGLEDLDVVVGATGLAVPLHPEDTWMDERDTEIEAI